MTAAERYAAQVANVVAQRTRLRGDQPPGDLFGALPPNHPLLRAEPQRPTYPNWETIAAYLEPEDVLLDIGGGAGRISLPLALRCREVVNVEPSPAMSAAFRANADRGGVHNARVVTGDWLAVEPPEGDVALVAHVLYLTQEIEAFIARLNAAARRRVIVIVGAPPPPTRNRVLFQRVFGEEEALVPGQEALVPVLWELGLLPDVRVVPGGSITFPPMPTREEAIAQEVVRFPAEQWALWPLSPELEQRLRRVLDDEFDTLFTSTPDGFLPRWTPGASEVLITWEPPAH